VSVNFGLTIVSTISQTHLLFANFAVFNDLSFVLPFCIQKLLVLISIRSTNLGLVHVVVFYIQSYALVVHAARALFTVSISLLLQPHLKCLSRSRQVNVVT